MQTDQKSFNKYLLGVAFVFGISGIVFLKIKYSELVFWHICWPIFTIIFYWLVAFRTNHENLYDLIGDNCYYLGFVFTLTSLGTTLNSFYLRGDEIPVNDVISGFGIALSSTILGIVIRVLMLHMTPDIARQEDEARFELDLAVRDFQTHLRMSLDELKGFSTETTQRLAEQRNAVQEVLAQDAEAHKRATEASTTALIKFSEDTVRKLEDHRTSIQEGMEQNARIYQETMQKGITECIAVFDRTSVALSETEAQVRDALRRSVDDQIQALESGADVLRRVMGDTIEAFAEYRKEANRQADLSRTTFEHTQESAEVARKELERIKILTESTETLSRKSLGLDAALTDLVHKLAAVEDGIAMKLQPAVAKMSDGTTAVSEMLSEASGKLKLAAERFEIAADRTAAADMQTNMASAVESIAKATERLDRANGALAAATEKIDELVDVTAKPRGILGRIFSRRNR